jgi:hypothetical protein
LTYDWNNSDVKVDTAIDCNSKTYEKFRVGVSFFIALYQTVPLVWIVLLYRLRGSLVPPTSNNDDNLALHIRERNYRLDALRFLFNDCKLHGCDILAAPCVMITFLLILM